MTDTPRSTMDFFEHQDRAKARSQRFVMLYGITVVLIIVLTGLAAGAYPYLSSQASGSSRIFEALLHGSIASVVVAVLIIGATLYKISELKGGGSTIARSLGGIPIDPSTKDPHQRQLLNIVEEMAIASGIPVPPVYYMPNERGINAFAAGYHTGDAVIGVTDGCLRGLTRDELQGVIAHEFSHILNGDMKLNIRMIGFLGGFMFLTSIGDFLFHAAFYTGGSRRKDDNNGIPLMVLAIVLMILGSIGALAARILQSAVSRQREFLADASAVQFTRNPDGIANALRRIGSRGTRTRVRHPRSSELAHMYFGTSSTSALASAFATHPPINQRIKRINPAWDGTMLEPLVDTTPDIEELVNLEKVNKIRDQRDPQPTHAAAVAAAVMPFLSHAGSVSPDHVDHARSIITSIPDPLKHAAHDISHSRAVVYALLLDTKDAKVHEDQINHLKTHADPAIAQVTESIASLAISLKPELRLPLLDMTLASLAHLSDNQHTTFRANVNALAEMDEHLSLFEWVTYTVLSRHLDERFGQASKARTQYYALNKLKHESAILLSCIAYAGAQDKDDAPTAFNLGRNHLHLPDIDLLPADQATLPNLDAAIKKLNECSLKVKRELLQASALTAGADHTITTTEAELLRAIADTFGIPTPPLLPNQSLN